MALPKLYTTPITLDCPPVDQKKTYVLAHASAEENGSLIEFYLVGVWSKQLDLMMNVIESRMRLWVISVQTTQDGVFITTTPIKVKMEDGQYRQWSLSLMDYTANRALFFVRMQSRANPLWFSYGIVTYKQIDADYEDDLEGPTSNTIFNDVTMVIVNCIMRTNGTWLINTDSFAMTLGAVIVPTSIRCIASRNLMIMSFDNNWLAFVHDGRQFIDDDLFVKNSQRELTLGDIYVDPFRRGGTIWYYFYKRTREFIIIYFVQIKIVNKEVRPYKMLEAHLPISRQQTFYVTVYHKKEYIDVQFHASQYGSGIVSATFPFKIRREVLFGTKHLHIFPSFGYEYHKDLEEVGVEGESRYDTNSGLSPSLYFKTGSTAWDVVRNVYKKSLSYATKLTSTLFNNREEINHIESIRPNAHISGLVFHNTHTLMSDSIDIFYGQKMIAYSEPFSVKGIVLGMHREREDPDLAFFSGVSSGIMATDSSLPYPNVETEGLILFTKKPPQIYVLPQETESTPESSTLLASRPTVKAFSEMQCKE